MAQKDAAQKDAAQKDAAQKDAAQKDAAQKAREGSIEHWIEYYQAERRKPPVPSEEPHSSEPFPVKPGEPQATPAMAGQK